MTRVGPAAGVTMTPAGPPNGGNPAEALSPLPPFWYLTLFALSIALAGAAFPPQNPRDWSPTEVIVSFGEVTSTFVLMIVRVATALVLPPIELVQTHRKIPASGKWAG